MKKRDLQLPCHPHRMRMLLREQKKRLTTLVQQPRPCWFLCFDVVSLIYGYLDHQVPFGHNLLRMVVWHEFFSVEASFLLGEEGTKGGYGCGHGGYKVFTSSSCFSLVKMPTNDQLSITLQMDTIIHATTTESDTFLFNLDDQWAYPSCVSLWRHVARS
jgi:hypothetical protein